MKKKIAALLGITLLSFNLFGCGKTITTEDGVERHVYGRFIELDCNSFDDEAGSGHLQHLVYDKDTKIIYIYETCGGVYGGVSISPYYVMDANNNPVIAVYNGDN